MRSRTLSLLLMMFVAAAAFGQEPAPPAEPPAETDVGEAEGFGSMAKSGQLWPDAQTAGLPRHADFLELQLGSQFAGRDPDSSKFEEYRDVSGGLYIPYVYYMRDEVSIRGVDLGQRDQRLSLGFDLGAWSMAVDYDEIPHFWGNDGRTLHQQTSRGVWEVSDTLQGAFQNAIAAVPRASVNFTFLRDLVAPSFNAGNVVDIEARREKIAVAASMGETTDDGLPGAMTTRLTASHETRSGDKPAGGAFGFGNVVQVPEPTEYSVDSVGASLELIVPRGLIRGGLRVNQFDNRAETLTFDNPFRAVDSTDPNAYQSPGGASVNGPRLGRIALQPDNRALTANVGGLFRLPGNSRLSGDLVVGRMVQDQLLLPFATNTAITAPFDATDPANLPVDRFEGQIDTMALNVNFNSRPWTNVGINARVRMYDLDNGSDRIRFEQGYARFDSSWNSTGRITVPYSYRNDRADVSVSYDFGFAGVEAGFDHIRMHRDFRDTEETTENVFRIAGDMRPASWAAARLSFETGSRDYAHYDGEESEHASFLVPGAPANHTLLRRFDQSKRELNRVSAMVQLTPTEAWAMTAQFWSQDEDFDEVPLGLLSAKSRTFSVEADYTPGELWNAYAFVTSEGWSTFQRGRQSGATLSFNPADDWTADIDMDGMSAGIGGNLRIIPERLDLRVLARAQRINGFNDMESPPGGTPDFAVDVAEFGDMNIVAASAELEYRLQRYLSFALGAWFEQYEVRDAYSSGVTNYMPGGFFLDPQDEDYDGGAIYIRASYRR